MTRAAAGGVSGGVEVRESDEVLLVRARRRLRDLAVQLEVAPFAPSTAEAMRVYLTDADRVGAAFARWCALTPSVRAQRAAAASEVLS
ncbi:hypothetical protein ACWCQP_45980 [Streptomyces chartreusis]